ncbi:hypothetical protein ACJX0J_019389 [Zea mays]
MCMVPKLSLSAGIGNKGYCLRLTTIENNLCLTLVALELILFFFFLHKDRYLSFLQEGSAILEPYKKKTKLKKNNMNISSNGRGFLFLLLLYPRYYHTVLLALIILRYNSQAGYIISGWTNPVSNNTFISLTKKVKLSKCIIYLETGTSFHIFFSLN